MSVDVTVREFLAHNTDKTMTEAHRVWWLVDRPNLFKIPTTPPDCWPSRHALAAGISINMILSSPGAAISK